jgi:hypothetical protein
VGLNLVEIEEVAPNGTVVRTASALKGNTRATDTTAHARHDTTGHHTTRHTANNVNRVRRMEHRTGARLRGRGADLPILG